MIELLRILDSRTAATVDNYRYISSDIDISRRHLMGLARFPKLGNGILFIKSFVILQNFHRYLHLRLSGPELAVFTYQITSTCHTPLVPIDISIETLQGTYFSTLIVSYAC
jgi:hypothetical protein